MPSGGSSKQTVGYKYYLGSHIGLCHGPIDAITEIQVDKRVAWTGIVTDGTITVDAPTLFGGEKREGGVSGTIDVEMGYPAQLPNAYLQSQLGTDIPAFRGVASLVFNQVYMGNNPYLKPWKFLASRIDVTSNGENQWYLAKASIDRGQCNEDSDAFDCFALRSASWDHFGIFSDNNGTSHTFSPFSSLGGGSARYECDINAPSSCEVENPSSGTATCNVENHYATLTSANPHPTKILPSTTTGRVAVGTVAKLEATGFINDRIPILAINSANTVLVSGRSIALMYKVNTSTNQVESLILSNSTVGTGDVVIPIPPPPLDTWFYAELGLVVSGNTGQVEPAIIDVHIAYCDGGSQVSQSYSNSESFELDYDTTFENQIPFHFGLQLSIANINEGSYSVNWGIRAGWYYEGALVDNRSAYFRSTVDCADNDLPCAFCQDMNPAHIIRECLTDSNWGMCYADSDIDDTAFNAAADTLFSEGMGISVLWEKEQPIEDFIGEILRHIDGVLYVSRETGKFVLKLIREEAPTLTLDETNVSEVTNARRPTINELTNSVSVVYWDATTDENASVMAHNEALRLVQGYEISTTAQYPGFTNKAIAARVAERDLKALSTPLLTCELTANREAASLNVGDVFYLDWPDLNINNTVMRVDEIGYGDGRDNSIKIVAVQDVFSTPAAATIGDQDSEWVDPISAEPHEAVATITQEAPYYPYVLTVGEPQANDVLADDPDAGFLLASAGRQGNELNANVFVDSGSGYVESATTDFHPYAYLASSISYTDSTIEVENGKDLDLIEDNTIAQIGGELVRVDSVIEDSTGAFTVTVGRGILDTVPGEHVAGAQIAFWGDYAVTDNEQYAAGEQIGVKFQPVLGSTAFDIDGAAAESADFDSRAIRPYPPGNLKLDGLSYPEDYLWTASHTLTWAHRDRLQQTDGNLYDYTEGDIGPEAGTSYIVEGIAEYRDVRNVDALRIEPGISYAESDITTDWGDGLGGAGAQDEQDFCIEFSLNLDSKIMLGDNALIIGNKTLSGDVPVDSTGDPYGFFEFRIRGSNIGQLFTFNAGGSTSLLYYARDPSEWGIYLEPGRWYDFRIASTFDLVTSTRWLTIYVNGESLAARELGQIGFTTEPIRLGNTGDSTYESWKPDLGFTDSNPWSGYIANLRITVGDNRTEEADSTRSTLAGSYVVDVPFPTGGSDPFWGDVITSITFDGDLTDGVSGNVWVTEGATIETAPEDAIQLSEEKFLEVNVGTDTSYTFDIDSGLFDSNYSEPPEGTTAIILGVKSRRDGYDSWQYPQIRLQYPGFTDSVGDSVGEIDSTGAPFDSVGDSIGDSVGGDPFFSNVSLLLHMDGSDGSTAFTDSSSNGLTVTANGNAQIDTAQSKFGGASALFDGGGDSLSVPHDAAFTLESGDFTIECWVRSNGSSSGRRYIVQKGGQSGATFSHWGLDMQSDGTIRAQLGRATGSLSRDLITSTGTYDDSAWHHVAFTRSGNTLRLFVDGTQEGGDVSVSVTPLDSASYGFTVGTYPGGTDDFDGWIDDVRITKGVARYTSSFTPPTEAFPDS